MTNRTWIALGLALAACGGSSAPAPTPSCTQDGCATGEVCEATACKRVEPLAIATATLGPATAGKAYGQAVAATGGAAPYRWSLAQKAPALAWLTLSADGGQLSGTPQAAVGGAGLQIRLEDASRQVAERSFALDVRACADGDTVSCFGPLAGGGCGMGTATCAGGNPGVCGALAPSAEVGHCGDACGACDPALANGCANGACSCGTAPACGSGSTCCGSGPDATCVDTSASAAHCGACGKACRAPANGEARCDQGTCGWVCKAGFDTCDPTQPCGTDLRASADNCGACGNACAAGHTGCVAGACVCGAEPRCTGGACCAADADTASPHCASPGGRAQPGGGVADCGTCGKPCAAPVNGTALCAAGICGAVCNEDATARWADCSVAAGTTPVACTANLLTGRPDSGRILDCGACGNNCVPPDSNTVASCVQGQCAYACQAGFSFCSGSSCLPLDSASSCGSSCEQCRVLGSPALGAALHLEPSTTASCCRRTDPVTRSCLEPCAAGSGAGACGCAWTCEAGWADCQPDAVASATVAPNGCESSLGSANSCGSCGNECPSYPNTRPACQDYASGLCSSSCQAPYADCNDSLLSPGPGNDGCEIDTWTDTAHCGGCRRPCPSAGVNHVAAVACTTGVCSATCQAGWGDCNGDRDLATGNGCEQALDTAQHCGGCNSPCPAPGAAAPPPGMSYGCGGGVCSLVCLPGYQHCPGQVGCVSLGSSLNCGGCGIECTGIFERCVSGGCRCVPPAGAQCP